VGDWTVLLTVDALVPAATYLRDAAGARFDFLSDLTASDWPPRAKRFDVIYSLYSISLRHRVRVKVQAGDGEAVPTVTRVWPSANWLEREVFDLFGIRFDGHPDLRRILMPDDWQGHPQRKDYPLEGPGELLMENPLDWLNLKHRQEIE
jgi:NADH-quinone oxidoreductase subunit C